ncbi:hypothetical protein [Porphyromonas bennonis]|uniref:hypothetical protein n=1 Tax=Porphyromonas bennonis TaxID=501496 RepID=UPI000379C3E1|nr:hypothetical protein [Porphyromonas bennonis]
MSEVTKKTRPVAFSCVELGQMENSDSSIHLVLKTLSDEPLEEYLVPIPRRCNNEYMEVIQNMVSGKIQSADSFLRDLLLATDCTLSNLVIRHDGDGDRAEMKMMTSDMEMIPFDVPMHEGVLHAMVSGLPIFVEEELLVPSIRRDGWMKDGVMQRRTPETEYNILSYELSKGRLPEDYEADRLAASLDAIGEERVSALQREAIETERYEWAQWIKEYRDKE